MRKKFRKKCKDRLLNRSTDEPSICGIMKTKLKKLVTLIAIVSAGCALSGCQPEHLAAFNEGFQMGSQMAAGNYNYGGY